ncbi:EamA family transporter [Paucibacter soli]|uniref:EamA family transporter n=1 Tax=Paucibacter soli TaxID=3133433 RepID=UPI0030A0224F
MSPLALALVVTAALCHAAWNLIAKKAGGGQALVLLIALLVVVLWAPLLPWLELEQVVNWGWKELLVLAASAGLHVVYYHCLMHGYAVADLSVVYPVARGSGPLLSSAGALLLLSERLSLLGALGALGVVGGVFLIAGGPAMLGGGRAQPSEQRRRVRQGLLWGALTGACIAGYTLVDGYAVKVLAIAPALAYFANNLLRVPLQLPLLAPARRAATLAVWRTRWRAALAIALLSPVSYVLVLHAMRMAPVSHVAPARELSMLFAAIAGGSLLGEGDRLLRLLGAGCIALGVAALALG